MFSRVRILKYSNGFYKIINTPITFKSNCKKFVDKPNDNQKYYNNVVRARNKLFDYAYNNEFSYFVTITMSPKYDRNDLKFLNKLVGQTIRDMRKYYKSDLKYLLIPEQHKKGGWHLHGLFSFEFGKDMYINDNGYLSLSSFDKIGFTSISKIINYEACCKYITKYITKDLINREKGSRLYFYSRNLKLPEVIEDFITTEFRDTVYYDYCNEFCKLKVINNDNIDDYLINLKDLMCYSDLMG